MDRPQGKLAGLLLSLLEWAAALLMGSLAILVLSNALGRYFFASPLPWTEEVALNVLVWIGGVGVVLAGANRTLICCDVISRRISSATASVLTPFCALLGAGVMLFFSWLTWEYLLLFWSDLSPVLRIPKLVMISALLFATLGLAATLLIPIFRR